MSETLALPTIFQAERPVQDGAQAANVLRLSIGTKENRAISHSQWFADFADAFNRRDIFALRHLVLTPEYEARAIFEAMKPPFGLEFSWADDRRAWRSLLAWAGSPSDEDIATYLARAVDAFTSAADEFDDQGRALRAKIELFIESGPALLSKEGGRWLLSRPNATENAITVSYGASPAVQLADALLALHEHQARMRKARALSRVVSTVRVAHFL